MVSLPKPEIILTHESDLDGLVSGVLLQRLARALFNAEIPLEANHYHTWRQREPRENAAWVCDLSFEPRLDRANWVIVDHHATELLPKKAQLIHDVSKSAGTLCYELCVQQGLQSPELDRLVQLNNVADLFLEGRSGLFTRQRFGQSRQGLRVLELACAGRRGASKNCLDTPCSR
jgi:nanoRNase/pAp phosphatase (c-di-AMP/oligoRNAs hydrolase)